MKVLRLTTGLDFGGVEKMYELFATHYKGEHEYVFLALGPDGRTGQKLRDLGFEALAFGFKNASVYNPKVTLKLWRWLRKQRFDIIHCASAEANFHGTIAAKLSGVPVVVVEEIGIPNHSKLARKVFRTVYRFVDDFVWESSAIQNHLIKLGEVKPGRGEVIHNPVVIPPLTEKEQKYDSDTFVDSEHRQAHPGEEL